MHTLRFVVVFILMAAPAWAQDWSAVSSAMVDLDHAGYFERCRSGDGRGCSLFTRAVAARLNPQGDGGGWGWLAKPPGGTQYDGYAEDAMVWTADAGNLRNVVDIVCGSGAPGARPCAPTAFVARRASDTWTAPRPLDASELAYLGVTGSGGGGGGGNPTPTPDYSARLSAIEQQLRGLTDLLMGRYGTLLEQASAEARTAAERAEDLQRRTEDLKHRVDAIRVPAWPVYRGAVLGFGVTLRPQEP